MDKKQHKNKSSKKKIIIWSIVVFFVLVAASGLFGEDTKTNNTNTQPTAKENKQTKEPARKKEVKQKPKSLANKVKAALDALGEDMKDELASTSPDGYRGEIISVEPASGNDTVKVNVSTYFKGSGDEPDGGQNIARKIFGSICIDVPELNSLYVVSTSSKLESKSIYRSDIPGCKQ